LAHPIVEKNAMTTALRLPTDVEILDIARSFGMTLTANDAASFRGLMAGSMASYARLDELAEPKLPVKYPRTQGFRPTPQENPYNA
jgi:amidase